ncbi:hypothetical protein GGI21_004840 [Coemansia aciculifera]|nr:hypothetical protein GGI21_004840 [Coemansia aciculifera]
MSKYTTESTLQDVFEGYGPVNHIQLIRDKPKAESRGYAFITMANMADAQKARNELNDTVINNRRVRVDFSFTSRAHSPKPGRLRGQDTGGHFLSHGKGRREYANDEYRGAAYPPRRRANSRDRRRRDYQQGDSVRYYEPPPMTTTPRRDRRGGRSRSPSRRESSSNGAYQPPPLLATRSSYGSYRSSNNTDHGRGGREYRGSTYGPSRSRSPPSRRSGYGDYHRRSDSRNRRSHADHRHDMYDRPLPPPSY